MYPGLYSKIEVTDNRKQVIASGFVANVNTVGKVAVALTNTPDKIFEIQKALTRVDPNWTVEKREAILREHCHYIYTINCLTKWREVLYDYQGRSIALLSSEGRPIWTGPVFESDAYMMKSWRENIKTRQDYFVKDTFATVDIPDEQYNKNKEAALYWKSVGIPNHSSTGICEGLTRGYGRLDDLGYFEYPLPME